MFRAPQWHGATQTHLPCKSCKSHGSATSRMRSPALRLPHYRQWLSRIPPGHPAQKRTRQVSKTSVSYALPRAACHARSPQKVTRDKSKTHSHLHFAPSTRTISSRGSRFVALPAAPPPALREKDKKSERTRRCEMPADVKMSRDVGRCANFDALDAKM